MSVIGKLSLSIQTTLGDSRAASAVLVGNGSFNIAWAYGWIQSNIGFIGAVLGLVLTVVTIYAQVLNVRKASAELEILRRKLEE